MYRVLSTADWHLRSTVPSCVDATPTEWMKIQKSVYRVGEINLPFIRK